MTDTTASRLGQINASGSTDAIFLKKFGGEVVSSFDRHTVMDPLGMKRTIQNGKSAQFPSTGRATTAYHSAGENILDPTNSLLSTINANERVVTVDSKLLAATFVDEVDELKNHYDIRSEYASQLGEALAWENDLRLMRIGVLGARDTTARITGSGVAGEAITDADFETNGSSAVDTIYTIAQKFDEKHVPKSDRFVIVTPQAYWTLVKQTDLVNTDISGSGNGNFAQGIVKEAGGIKIIASNAMLALRDLGSSGVFTADAGEGDDTSGTYTNTVALAMQKEGLASVILKGMKMEMQYKVEYQGTLMVASFVQGHNYLRNECLIEIKTA